MVFQWMAAACLAVFLCGCSSVRVLRSDPSFTYETLLQDGMAIGCVTRADTIDYYAEKPIAEFFQNKFTRAWPGVKIVSMEQVEQLLGTNDFRALKVDFHEEGALSKASIPLLKPLKGKVRYLFLVDMRQDEARSYDATGYRPIFETIYNPDTRRYETYETGQELIRTRGNSRDIKTAFIIYDLETFEQAWVGSASASGGFANTESDWLFVPRVRDTGNYSPTDLLESIGKDLLKKLPHPDK
jgi:hypothetical protein